MFGFCWLCYVVFVAAAIRDKKRFIIYFCWGGRYKVDKIF